jgi:MFS family permease
LSETRIPSSKRALTAGLIAIVSITAFEALAAATVLPAVVKELGGLAWYGGAFSGFMAMNVASIVLVGRRADEVGVVRPFLTGCAAFVLGLVVAGVATAMPVVVLGRMIQGFGAGAISSVSYVAVARGYTAEEKPRMLALLSSAWVVPGLVGPAIAAQVADLVSWRAVFIGLAPFALLAAAVATPGLRQLPAPPRAGAPPSLREIFSAGAPPAKVSVARAALLSMALLTWTFFGTEAFVPLTLTSVRQASLTSAGLALTSATLSWTAGAWVQERLARRGRHRALVRVGLALLGAGVAGFATLLASAVPIFAGVAAWAVAGLGMGIAYSTLSLVILGVPEAGREGVAATALQLVNVLGIAAGTGAGGVLVAAAVSLHRPESYGVAAADLTMVLAACVAFAAAGALPAREGAATDPSRSA